MAKKTERNRRRRATISERQNHRCAYCGQRMQEHDPDADDALTLDHLQTRFHGGRTHQRNLVAACRRCNNLRQTENAQRFYRRKGWLAENPVA